jgi:hypothetical protein
MKTPIKIALISAITLLPVAAVVVYGVMVKSDSQDAPPGKPGSYKEIDWRLLRGLDLNSSQKPPELAAIDGQFIKVPGFIVPLDDDASSYSEFLLVPSPQACIHVPPPPANQMIMVRMRGGKAPQRSWGPVWILGRIHISSNESQYGKISYMLHGDSSEPYRMNDEGGALPPP